MTKIPPKLRQQLVREGVDVNNLSGPEAPDLSLIDLPTSEPMGKDKVNRHPPSKSVVRGGALAFSSAEIAEQAQNLVDVAQGVGDEKLKALLEKGAAAAQSVAQYGRLPTPPRIALTKDESRPEFMSGVLDRVAFRDQLKTTFRPFNRNVSAIPLSPNDVEGLPDRARLQLVLENANVDEQTYVVKAASSEEFSSEMVGRVVDEDGQLFAVALSDKSPYRKAPLRSDTSASLVGQTIIADVYKGEAKVLRSLEGESPIRTKILTLAGDRGIPLVFAPKAMREVAALEKNPGIEGELFDKPFLTLDKPDSMDLDQAMCIERKGNGYVVHYAIADASHFVKEGSALDREARRRMQTSYVPGGALPMIPGQITNNLCSLLPDGPRRALVVSVELDSSGRPIRPPRKEDFRRCLIQSRAKLAYGQVQAFYDKTKFEPDQSANMLFEGNLGGHEFTPTVDLLRELGGKLVSRAQERGMQIQDREGEEIYLSPTKSGDSVEVHREPGFEVEGFNEQISLLANNWVGQFFKQQGVHALFRNQRAPDEEKLEAFREQTEKLGRPWKEGLTKDQYLESLDPKDPLTAGIKILSYRASSSADYEPDSKGHDSLKLDDYLHFTGPMRRYPDIIAHRILAALIEGKPPPHQSIGELKRFARRIESMGERNGRLGAEANRYLIAKLLEHRKGEQFSGTITNVSPGGLMVLLDSPPVKVRVPSSFMDSRTDGYHAMSHAGIALSGPSGTYRWGDRLDVVLSRVNPERLNVDAVPAKLWK